MRRVRREGIVDTKGLQMPLTESDLAIRRERLSATDLGAIVGVNPYRSPADVQAEKLYDVAPVPENESMALGTMFERPIVEWVAGELGVNVRYPMPTTIHPVYDFLCATGDAQVVDKPRGIEAKTDGIRGGRLVGEWGAQGSADVPEMYAVQVQVQMAVMGWDVVHLGAVIVGRGCVMFTLERDPEMIDGLVDIAARWRERHIVRREPCVDDGGKIIYPSLDTLKRIRRVPESTCEVPRELFDRWVAAREAAKAAETAADEAKQALVASLRDCDGGTVGGELAVTFNEQSRGGVDRDRLALLYPEAFEATKTTSTFRVLRDKLTKTARKGGKVMV